MQHQIRRALAVIVFFSHAVVGQERIRCYECDNAGSHSHCMRIGQVKRCQSNERSCMTEIRRVRSSFTGIRITKRCKEARACDNNFWQNTGGKPAVAQATGRQCAGEKGLPFSSTTCRCCCFSDLCNHGVYEACLSVPLRDELAGSVFEVAPREPECIPLNFPNGKMTCSRKNEASSHCRFRCNFKYRMFGNRETSCQKTDGYNVKWTSKPPCCARSCPPYAHADLLLAIHSYVPSSNDWRKIKALLVSVLSEFILPSDADTRVGFFTFCDKIDKKNEVFLRNDFVRPRDMIRRVMGIQQNFYSGMNLEGAMRHAQRYSLTHYRGDRADVRDILILVTYGDVQNEQSSMTIPARQLRDDGAVILAINIQPAGREISTTFLRKLTDITGSRSKVFTVGNNPGSSMALLSSRLTSAICGNPCKRYLTIRNEIRDRQAD